MVGPDMRVRRIGKAARRWIERGVLRQPLAGDVDLERGRIGAVALDVANEIGRQALSRQKLQKRELGADIARDDVRLDPSAVGERNTGRASRPTVSIAATSALVRISRPFAWPDAAIACVIVPMPPRMKPQPPAPACSPITWCMMT